MARVWMVAYDISDDGHRRRVDKILSGFGKRVQKSVFECQFGVDDLGKVRGWMRSFLGTSSDSVRYYPLCAYCQGRTLYLGKGEAPAPEEPYLIL